MSGRKNRGGKNNELHKNKEETEQRKIYIK